MHPEPDPKPAALSPRRRRLRLTLGIMTAVVVIGAGLEWWFSIRSKPVQYRPDEVSADITSDLAKDLPADAPRPRFIDSTRSAGLSEFKNFVGSRTSEMPEDIGPGLAWGDFDNDGDDDLFLVSAGGAMNLPEAQLLPCQLFENLGNGTFRAHPGFPEIRIHGNGAAWGDYDGDGFLDLVVSGYNALLLFHNEPAPGGGRRFVRDTNFPNPPGFWTGVSWGDYDNDRALDLYVCGYIQYVVSDEDRSKTSAQISTMVPFTLNPSSFDGGTNLLFHNQGGGRFEEVAKKLGVANPEGRSLGALWHDFDDDGWLDLYVANDVSDNVFFHNRGGTFEDISHPALVADHRSAMGMAVGDYNRDGDDDLFIAHWVAQENALYDNTWADFNIPRGPATNEVRKSYPLRFVDVADMKGLGQIALPYVGWGTEFVDFDGDGWLDLVVANGSTLEEDGPPPRKLKAQDTLLFWNRRAEYFHNLAPLHPGLASKHNSRGLAVADFDGDGAMDLAIADLGEGVRLYRNDMQKGHWLKLRLKSRTQTGKPVGVGSGSRILARANGVTHRRCVSGASYLSQSSSTLHIGLGSASVVDQLEVRWHAGATNVFTNLAADAFYELVEGDSELRRISAPIAVPVAASIPPRASAAPLDARQRAREFWVAQRAAMNAMKVETNNAKAIPLFRQALALDPAHEDSLYYLASCLASQGETQEALAQLAELKRLNPQSLRAFSQWGSLRAQTSRNPESLAAAEESLQRAHAINPEETGALLVLGEVALLRGDSKLAEERFRAACATNPKAVGGYFLRGYIAWAGGDAATASKWLRDARSALGKDWQPKGSTSEGDTARKQHIERTPLTTFWEDWDGTDHPKTSFARLAVFLKAAQ